MKKFISFIRRNRSIIIMVCIFIPLGIPFFIHILFSFYPKNEFWIAKWSAGEILSYAGTVLSFWGTVILSSIAIYQNKQVKEINSRMLRLEEISKKAYIVYDNIGFDKENKVISIVFKNITQVEIANFQVKNSDYLFRVNEWKSCEKAKLSSEIIISNIEDKLFIHGYYAGHDLVLMIKEQSIKKGDIFSICCVTEVTSIFGYKTYQRFSFTLCWPLCYDTISVAEVHTMEIDIKKNMR